MTIVSYFNEKYHDFKEILLNPSVGSKQIVRKSNLMLGVKQLASFMFIIGFIGVVLSALGGILGGLVGLIAGKSTSLVVEALVMSILSIVGYVLFFIPTYFIILVMSFIFFGVMWIIAKLLGGKSDYGTYFGALTFPCIITMFLFVITWGLVNLLASLIAPFSTSIAGIIALLAFVPGLLASLYGIWLFINITQEAHQIDTMRAAIAVIVPVLGETLLAVVIVVVVSFILSSLNLIGNLMSFI